MYGVPRLRHSCIGIYSIYIMSILESPSRTDRAHNVAKLGNQAMCIAKPSAYRIMLLAHNPVVRGKRYRNSPLLQGAPVLVPPTTSRHSVLVQTAGRGPRSAQGSGMRTHSCGETLQAGYSGTRGVWKHLSCEDPRLHGWWRSAGEALQRAHHER